MTEREKFKKLCESFNIGRVKLRNRIVKSPAITGFADKDGNAGERVKNFYEEIAKGGVGMIIVESTLSDYPRGRSSPTAQLFIWDDKFIPGLAELAQAIHKHSCPVFLQLGHAGPAHPQRLGLQPVAPSSLPKSEMPNPLFDIASELTIAGIREIVDKFGKAAERARKAGFDGLELHGSHPYLINSFLSRAYNRRQDAYGCQDFKSRARFAVEIIQAIKGYAGEDFPVGIQINGAEYGIENGLTSGETHEISQILEDAGADYINVSVMGYGDYESIPFPEQILYPEPPETVIPLLKEVKRSRVLVPLAEAIKKAVSIPVIVGGRLGPEVGEWILRKGKADLIAMNRRLLADPELPKKVASGRLEDIAPCTACLTCFNAFRSGEALRCRINPALGREREYAIIAAAKKKRVMVIGGGPAGMEAARVAALRGNIVELYERSHKLGGLLPLASLINGLEIEDLTALIRYLGVQIAKLGVRITLGKEFSLALVEKIKPDVVVLATGGILIAPEIRGVKKRNVVSNSDLHRKAKFLLRFFGPKVLSQLTRFWLPLGRRVTIVGGSMQGCEVARFLVKRGRKVTIVETSNELGTGIPEVNRVRLLPWLTKKGVKMLTKVKYEEVTDKGLTLVTEGGERQTVETDTVLVATPPQKNGELFQALQGKVPEVYMIGDAEEPRLIIDAIADGSRVGRAI
jgi:2,4-dienoyl-CoA reductase (NADPH2)